MYQHPSTPVRQLPVISNVKSIRPNNNVTEFTIRIIGSSAHQARNVGNQHSLDSKYYWLISFFS